MLVWLLTAAKTVISSPLNTLSWPMVCDDSSDWATLTSGLLSACYPVSVFRCSPYARRCTGSCRLGRRADGWGLHGGGSAAELAGCRLGRSKGRRSGSRSHRRKQTGRGWSQSRRWCRFGLASSLQRGQESVVWQELFWFFLNKVHKTSNHFHSKLDSLAAHALLIISPRGKFFSKWHQVKFVSSGSF